MIEELTELFGGPGAGEYLGEPVTIGQHMLQTGALAQAAGADDALVAAALVHDVGHVRGETDRRHGDQGAAWLSQWFPVAVTEPVRLHVAAKRYLCGTEPDYYPKLSAESVRTLAIQGGPMSAAEFESSRFAQEAVSVRQWDDAAKDPGANPPEFAHFSALLDALARS